LGSAWFVRFFDRDHKQVVRQPMANGQPCRRVLQLREERVATAGAYDEGSPAWVRRRKRERRPLPGTMLFQDSSKHAWLGQGPGLDLIVSDGRRDQRDYFDFLVQGGGHGFE